MTKLAESTTEKRSSLSGVIGFKQFDHLFTSARLALWQLQERRKDAALKQQVRSYLGDESAKILSKFTQPRAVLFRQIATPTHEILKFLRMAKQMGLKPLILEYYSDKFVSAGNPYKRALGKLPIYQYTGTDGRDMVEYITVVDFNDSTGKPLREVRTNIKKPLIKLHHDLLIEVAKLNPKTHCFDASDWFSVSGEGADDYYANFLALFIRDGILFENFFTNRAEVDFVRDAVLPAFASMQEQFGVKPLIVRLVPEEKELRQFWDSYPKKVHKLLKKHLGK